MARNVNNIESRTYYFFVKSDRQFRIQRLDPRSGEPITSLSNPSTHAAVVVPPKSYWTIEVTRGTKGVQHSFYFDEQCDDFYRVISHIRGFRSGLSGLHVIKSPFVRRKS